MGRSCLFSRCVVYSHKKGYVAPQDVTLGGPSPGTPSPEGQLTLRAAPGRNVGNGGCGMG